MGLFRRKPKKVYPYYDVVIQPDGQYTVDRVTQEWRWGSYDYTPRENREKLPTYRNANTPEEAQKLVDAYIAEDKEKHRIAQEFKDNTIRKEIQ